VRATARFVREHRRFLAFGFALTFFSSFGQTFFVSLFGGEWRAQLGLTNGGFGLLYSLATLGSGLTLVWVGRLIDRADLRTFTACVCVGLVGASALVARTASVAMLAGGLYLLRLTGQGLLGHTAMTSMGRYFDRDRGKAVSLATIGLPAGQALLPPLAVLAMGRFGWRATWDGIAIGLALVLVPAMLWMLRGQVERHRRWEEEVASEAAAAGEAATAGEADRARDGGAAGAPARPVAVRSMTRGEVVRDTRFWRVLPACVACAFLLTGFLFHQVHLVEEKGWTLARYAAGFPVFAVAQTLGTLATGFLVDRRGAVRLLPFFLVPIAGGLAVLALSDAWGACLVYFVLAGTSAGASIAVGGALWAELFGTVHLGAIRALVSALFVGSTAVAPVAMGALIDRGVTMEAIAWGAVAYVAAATALAMGVGAGRHERRGV
jgi:MFS family permease